MSIVAILPMALPSASNLREHWSARHRRIRAHRSAAHLALKGRALPHGALATQQRLVVTLTRVAPRALDSDNLAAAFKGVRDGVADALGIDDGDPRVAWRYEQEKAIKPRQAAVGIRIEVLR